MTPMCMQCNVLLLSKLFVLPTQLAESVFPGLSGHVTIDDLPAHPQTLDLSGISR
jgi:hypothetical protein